MRTPHPLVLPAATAPVLFVPPLQHHRPAEHETGHGREQAQGDHCQEHLSPAAAAPQALEAEPHLPGGPTGGDGHCQAGLLEVLINPLLGDFQGEFP